MIKFTKILASILIFTFIGSAVLSLASPATVSAVAYSNCDDENKVLNFPHWYDGLQKRGPDGRCEIISPKDDAELTSFIWQIVLNCIGIAFVGVGYIALGFILYGGFQFIFSMGSADKMAKARTTILNACIGMVIAISATAIVNKFSVILPSAGVWPDAGTVITNVLDIFYFGIGALAVIVIIISGFTMIISGDKPDSITKARNAIIFSSIGILVIIFAKVITTFITGRF